MMLDHVCQGPVILVASSLGAWVSFLEFVVLGQTEYAQKYLPTLEIIFIFLQFLDFILRQNQNIFCEGEIIRHLLWGSREIK